MKPLLSPLVLSDFAVLNSNYRFIPLPDNMTNIRQIVSSYGLDINFAITPQANNTSVFIKASVNQGEDELPGYSLFAEGVAVFSLNKEADLSEEDKKTLLQYSAVSIALNSLRGFIASLTANAPLGRYILPSIDVNDLFQQKFKNQTKKKKPK